MHEAAPFVTFHIKLSDRLSPWESDRRFSQQGTWLIHLRAGLINLRCIMMHSGRKLFRYLFAGFTSSFNVLLMIEINRKVNWFDERESLASHTQKFTTPIRQPSIKAECFGAMCVWVVRYHFDWSWDSFRPDVSWTESCVHRIQNFDFLNSTSVKIFPYHQGTLLAFGIETSKPLNLFFV